MQRAEESRQNCIRKEDLEVKYYYDDEEQQEFLVFVGLHKDFQCLAGPRNMSVDLKYDVLCL